MIPYARQSIDENDIAAVVDVLRGDWLTTGPKVPEFEAAVANYVGANEAVAVSNGTAALHAMLAALEIGPGDEVIVPTLTFAATANAAMFVGATPVFVDVLPSTLLIDPAAVEAAITSRTKAIIAVDYAGQPCDYVELQRIAETHDVTLLADGCHSLGGAIDTRRVGNLARMTAFSFHPVKPITTGEGGMVTTNDTTLAAKLRQFRSHGISTDARQRAQQGTWFYEMLTLGYNYRMCDLQCALGISQLKKLDGWVARRMELATAYDTSFANQPHITPVTARADATHAYHLYVVQLEGCDRNEAFGQLRECGVGVNVHYIPVHLHPFYRERLGTQPGLCPVAEAAYERIVSLPLFPAMTDSQLETVVATLAEVLSGGHAAAA